MYNIGIRGIHAAREYMYDGINLPGLYYFLEYVLCKYYVHMYMTYDIRHTNTYST